MKYVGNLFVRRSFLRGKNSASKLIFLIILKFICGLNWGKVVYWISKLRS